ncbi:uncharacterized protein LOC122062731 [Macadamia integrifolia]|uniref:uncharacterized protein LOC122062731 n=1 Tax=Macadamia integrifolia TaxID=60698 RepID=UPI001C4FAA66|nr:uncharacterized protein LOC122062731 [Macadamia integrifolia]
MSQDHLFLSCSFSHTLWNSVGFHFMRISSSSSIQDWISSILALRIPKRSKDWLTALMTISVLNIKWDPPSSSFLKFNVDGSSIGCPAAAGFGGVLRDDKGAFLMGFAGSAGISYTFVAEALAVRQALSLAANQGVRSIIVESDNLMNFVADSLANFGCNFTDLVVWETTPRAFIFPLLLDDCNGTSRSRIVSSGAVAHLT